MTKVRRSNGNVSAAGNTAVQMVKLCRLCEAKDGPFLSIFDTDVDLASKIDALLPITVTAYDDLSHDICFRCSAKLSDLHEFVNKCIKTQENLHKTLNRTLPKLKTDGTMKSKKLWSARLTKSKMSNSTYCENMVRKALQSMGKNVTDSIKGKFNIPMSNVWSSNILNVDESKESKKIDVKDNEIEKQVCAEEKKDLPDLKLSVNATKRRDDNKVLDQSASNNSKQPTVQMSKRIGPKSATKTPVKSIVEEKNDLGKCNSKKNQESSIQKSIELDNKEKNDDFEKDIRVCISRVNSKDTSKEAHYEVKQDSSNTKKNVSTFKVAGVGTVYSCEDCSRIFLNKDKMPGHKCITDKSKIIKETIESNDTKLPSSDLVNLLKTLPKEQKTLLAERETKTVNIITKIPGPASKTIGVATPKNNSMSNQSPSVETLTIDSIMKNLVNAQMQYTLVQGPNNTLTLQASPQMINIPINVLQPQSLLTPSPVVTSTATLPQNKNADVPTQAKSIINSHTSQTPDFNNRKASQNSAFEELPTFPRRGRGRPKSQVLPTAINNDNTLVTSKSATIEPINNIKKPNQVQKEFSLVKVKPINPIKSSSTGGPFPVALAKNIYLSNSSSESQPIVIDDLPNLRENKRKSREVSDRSKKLKVNPEIIELDDDPEPAPEMEDLLEERPIATRARGRGKQKSDATKPPIEAPSISQQYRVVPNNNPRKLIISTVGSSQVTRKDLKKAKNMDTRKNSSNKYLANSTEDGDVSFFTHLGDDDCSETVIPDRTVVQESQVSTTVSTRPLKGRGSNAKESVGTQKCMMCSMSFSDNAKLSAHMKIHYANWI